MSNERNSVHPLMVITTIFTILTFVAVMFLAVYVLVKISAFESVAQNLARTLRMAQRVQGERPQGPRPTPQGAEVEASIDDDPIKGNPNAPVTIIEFSDFQCPFCGRWARNTLPQIYDKYIKTGKVRVVFRDFPLNFHQYAKTAAMAAECANEQGKFWQMHDKLFQNQRDLSRENIERFASEIGLNMSKFKQCLDSNKYASEVEKDMRDGMSYGVRGTPSFIIGKTQKGSKIIKGTFIRGAQPYPAFEQVIEKYLR